jgi:hypothetical protein
VDGLLTTQAAEAGVFVDDVEDEDDEDDEDDNILLDGDIDWSGDNHFEFLDSSLVGERDDESNPALQRPRPHVLLSYERSRSSRGKPLLTGGGVGRNFRSGNHASGGSNAFSSSSNGNATQPSSDAANLVPAISSRPALPIVATSRTKIRVPRWNFGIRSSSPPMEVTYELYKSLKFLSAEWREKRHPWYTPILCAHQCETQAIRWVLLQVLYAFPLSSPRL